MTVIKVPKTPKSAFNKSRPLSNLLKAQVGILETLAAGPARAGAMAAAVPQTTMPKTEGEAALYMATLAARVYPDVGVPPAAAAAGPVAPEAPMRAATARRGAAPAKPKRTARRRTAANRIRKAVKRKGAKKVVKKSATRRKASAVRRGNKAKTRKRRARR
jgi:hypothetical protein